MPVPRIPIWQRPLATKKQSRHADIAKWLPITSLLSLGIWFFTVRFLHIGHPPVGTYIGILALLAGLVTLWPPDSPRAKAMWLAIFGGFLVLEISTLYEQRAEDVETAKNNRVIEDNRFAALLKAQEDSFAEVLSKNQQEFNETIGRLEGIRTITSESLEEATGGKSFCFFMANVDPSNPGGRFPLMLVVVGKHPMHHTSAQIQTTQTSNDPNSVQKQLMSMHSIPLGDGNLLPGAHPVPESVPLGHYFFLIFSANGLLGQDLDLKIENGRSVMSIIVTRNGIMLYKSVDGKVVVPYKVK